MRNSGIVNGADYSYENVQQNVIDNLLKRVTSFLEEISDSCK